MEKNPLTWKTTFQMHNFFYHRYFDEYFSNIIDFLSTVFSPREFIIA
jgi:hypothetical protein